MDALILAAANWPFDRAFAPEGGQFYLIADSLIAMLALLMAAVAECSAIPTGAHLPGERVTAG